MEMETHDLNAARYTAFRNSIAECKLGNALPNLDNINCLDDLIALDEQSQQTSLHACLQRKNVVHECLKLLLDKFEALESSEGQIFHGRKKWTLYDYIAHQDERHGQNVAHMAAKSSSVAVLRTLFERAVDVDVFFAEDKNGYTPIRLMYLHAPKAVSSFLDSSIETLNHPSDGNFKIEFQFAFIVGAFSKQKVIQQSIDRTKQESCFSLGQSSSATEEEQKTPVKLYHSEMTLLAELVDKNDEGRGLILPHILVKSFLDFKWAKLKYWFAISIFLRIMFHILYTSFVVRVFLIDCRYDSSTNRSTNFTPKNFGTDNDDLPQSVLGYLFGNFFNRVVEAFSFSADSQDCKLDPMWVVAASLLFIYDGIIFAAKELIELCLVRKYWNLQNCLQVSCSICVVWVTSVAYWESATPSHYTAASIGVLLYGGLILQYVGNICGYGLHVYMLANAIETFFKFFLLYLAIIFAFSISFSIMFPHEAYQTLPQAISKVVVMMIGEFEYDETFYGKEQDAPHIFLTGQIILCCFAILLTILSMNMLVGVAVSDIAELKSKPEVIQLAIQVKQLALMESSLILFQDIFIYLQYMRHHFWRCCQLRPLKFSEAMPGYLDIYVIPYQQAFVMFPAKADPCENSQIFETSSDPLLDPRNWGDEMMIVKQIDEVFKELQQPLIKFGYTQIENSNNANSKSSHISN